MAVHQNFVCSVCGCLCDDIEVTVEENRILRARNACAMGVSKLINYYKERNTTPYIRRGEELKPASPEEAVDRIARFLVEAEYPIIYGFSLSSCEAVSVGIELAEEVGAVFDNQSTVCHGPGIQGVQDVGLPTCTLGEVKHRADLLVYWGANPTDAHPRHFERYSLNAEGRFWRGRGERRMVVVDVRLTPTARQADRFLQIRQGYDFEVLSALRTALRFETIEQKEVGGVPTEEIEELAEMMRSCEFGVIFYGQGLTQTLGKGRNIDAAVSLVAELNRYTKFAIMPIRGHFNVTGVNEVSTWQTGYPYAVDFSHGHPWYNPGETSIVDILARGESDAALIVGSDPIAHLPRVAAQHLVEHPLGVIDPATSLTALVADVVIPSAFSGIEATGVAYRMDRVPLPLKKVVEPPGGVLPDEEVLRSILRRVRTLKGVA